MVDNTTPFEREGEGFQSTTFYWDLISGYRVICRWNIAHPVLSDQGRSASPRVICCWSITHRVLCDQGRSVSPRVICCRSIAHRVLYEQGRSASPRVICCWNIAHRVLCDQEGVHHQVKREHLRFFWVVFTTILAHIKIPMLIFN